MNVRLFHGKTTGRGTDLGLALACLVVAVAGAALFALDFFLHSGRHHDVLPFDASEATKVSRHFRITLGIGAGLVFVGLLGALVFMVRVLLPGSRKLVYFWGNGGFGTFALRGESHPLWSQNECSPLELSAREKDANLLMFDATRAKLRISGDASIELYAPIVLGPSARTGRVFAVTEKDMAVPAEFARFREAVLGESPPLERLELDVPPSSRSTAFTRL